MAALVLPEEFKPGVTRIISSSDEATKELVTALESAPLTFTQNDLLQSVSNTVKSIPEGDLEEVLKTLVSLYAVRDSAGVPLTNFVDDVTDAVEETELKDALHKLTSDKFKERLSLLLHSNVLAFTSKARERQRGQEKMLCTAEMLTDIRPVFGSNNDDAPIAAVLTHTLKSSYHHGRYLKEFALGLDSDDLDILEDLIDQARSESSQLKLILDKAEVPYPEDE